MLVEHGYRVPSGFVLTRQIVEAHGGQIGVVGDLGQGASFWFTLPLMLNQPQT